MMPATALRRMSTFAKSSNIPWQDMTRTELDIAYNNSNAVPNSAVLINDWKARSPLFRQNYKDMGALLELEYGLGDRNKIDIYLCGKSNAPLFVFIHGGYWQWNSKESFACMAQGPLARGMDFASIGYTLAPEATLSKITTEISEAVLCLRSIGPSYGVAKDKLVLSGWSAGGHLAAAAIKMDEVDAALTISGIFDVRPCQKNYLNNNLRLTAEEAAENSPLLHLPERSARVVVAYGTNELHQLQQQSINYFEALRGAGLHSELLPISDVNHFTIMHGLEDPDGILVTTALRQIEC